VLVAQPLEDPLRGVLLFGRLSLSSSRIRSMIPVNGSSFGRAACDFGYRHSPAATYWDFLSGALRPASANGAVSDRPALTITGEIPMQIRRRGVEKKFVVGGDCEASFRVGEALLKAVARAHCWFEDLVAGRAASMVELARCEGIGKQYVSRLMRLAFLAPDIVEQIVSGRQPPELTAQSLLTSRHALPHDWAAQKRALGFDLHV
jgi:hypothetical protein